MRNVLIAVLALVLPHSANAEYLDLKDSINADRTPAVGAFFSPGNWNVGWLYTPSRTISVNQIQTRFSEPVDERLIAIWLFDELPSAGGEILRSSLFHPSTDFSGKVFEPIELLAGEDYFVAFHNVGGLGTNTVRSTDPNVESLSMMYVSQGDATFSRFETDSYDSQVILRFLNEPSVVTLILFPFLLTGIVCRKRAASHRHSLVDCQSLYGPNAWR